MVCEGVLGECGDGEDGYEDGQRALGSDDDDEDEVGVSNAIL